MRSSSVGADIVARRVAVATGLDLTDAERWCAVVAATVEELVCRGFTLVGEDVQVGDQESLVLQRFWERRASLTDEQMDAIHAMDPVGSAEALGLKVCFVAENPLGTTHSVAALAMAATGADYASPELARQVLWTVEAWFAGLAGDAPRAAAPGDGETAVA